MLHIPLRRKTCLKVRMRGMHEMTGQKVRCSKSFLASLNHFRDLKRKLPKTPKMLIAYTSLLRAGAAEPGEGQGGPFPPKNFQNQYSGGLSNG